MNGQPRNTYNILRHEVLVADDEEFSLSIVSRLFREIGIEEVHRASNGKEALDVLERDINHNIGLVVLDINMPKLNGLQVLKMIRTGKQGIYRSLPVVLLTGNTDRELVSAALALDADSFVAKPVSKAALENRILQISREDRPMKAVEEYEAVNVDAALKLMPKEPEQAPVKGPVIKRAPTPEKKGVRVALEDLVAGAVVAQPVLTSTKQVLLAPGIPISDRLLRKLKELDSVGESIPFVWIEET